MVSTKRIRLYFARVCPILGVGVNRIFNNKAPPAVHAVGILANICCVNLKMLAAMRTLRLHGLYLSTLADISFASILIVIIISAARPRIGRRRYGLGSHTGTMDWFGKSWRHTFFLKIG